MGTDGAVTARTPGYFQRPGVVLPILAAFPLLTLPLIGFSRSEASEASRVGALAGFFWLLGATHFATTLTFYLDGGNLRAFVSSARNRALYFLIPALLFCVPLAIQAGAHVPPLRRAAVMLLLLVRAMDFRHVARQHFGILQILKSQTPSPYPLWTRPAANGFFLLLALLQWLTFLHGGRFPAREAWAAALAVAAAALFLANLAGLLAPAARAGHLGAAWVPCGYFLFQSAGAALAAWDTRLYLMTLSMHYLEYHLVVAPRCFAAAASPGRILLWMKAHPVVYIAGLLALGGGITASLLGPQLAGALPALAPLQGGRIPTFLALFDGIVLTHFFVDGYLWRFRDPHHGPILRKLFAPPRAAIQNNG